MHWQRIAVLVAVAASLHAPRTTAASGAPAADTISAPYQQELYDLGYSVFLANSNPSDALKVAERALIAQPGNRSWLLKAAQAADWSNQPAKALDHWYALAAYDPSALPRATELARALQDRSRLRNLVARRLERDGDAALLRDYITLSEEMGRPEDALALLERPHREWPGDLVLSERARLYEQTGHPRQALAALESLNGVRALTAAEALRGAALWYGIGKPDQAWAVLQKSASAIAASETAFWETLSDLGWALGHTEPSLAASQRLIDRENGRSVDYQRIAEAALEHQPARCFQAALAGWRRYRQPGLLLLVLESGGRLQRWQELNALLHGLSGEERRLVDGSAQFWLKAAMIARQVGDTAAALRYSREALRREPANIELVAAHLWLLLDIGQVREAAQVAEAWAPKSRLSPALGDAVGAAFAAAGDLPRALPFYRIGFSAHRQDPAWLAAYADLLDQAGKPEGAYLARMMVVEILRGQRRKPLSGADRKELTRLTAQVVLPLKPGDALDRLMRRVARAEQDPASRDLVTSWLLGTERHDLARLWFFKAYACSSNRPVWARLNLALEQNDQLELARLLAESAEKLPYRDAIEAARRTGQLPMAETVAFERFQQNANDQLLDAQLRDLFGTGRTTARYGLSFLDQGGVGILENRLEGGLRLSNRWSAQLSLVDTRLLSAAGDSLVNHPGRISAFQLGVTRRHQDGALTLLGGVGDGLYTFFNAELKLEQRLSARLAAQAELRIGGRAEETLPLRVGGLKDEALLGLSWTLDPRFSLGLRGSAVALRDQARRPLGEGGGGDLELTHRVVSAWPDVGMRLFGGYHAYRRTGLPEGRTLALVPPGKQVDTFFVPASFGQTGGGVFWGQGWKNAYTRDWKSFGALDVSWNSVSGAGFHYELGVVGPLFGLDALLFSFSQDSGSFGNSDITTRIDLKYRYSF